MSDQIKCPECGADLTPRPGAILRCNRKPEEPCPFWRMVPDYEPFGFFIAKPPEKS